MYCSIPCLLRLLPPCLYAMQQVMIELVLGTDVSAEQEGGTAVCACLPSPPASAYPTCCPS